MRVEIVLLSTFLLLGGCIGTDLVDDPIVDGQLEISPERMALLVGNSEMADAIYFNTFGIEESVPIGWSSTPASIARVDASGLVTAESPGQALLFAAYSITKDTIRITVVQNESDVAFVDITAPKTSLSIGESITVMATARNINGGMASGSGVQWFSTDQTVVTIDGAGTVTAQGSGIAKIYATINGVFSNEIEITVGGGKRMGTFQPANGYDASGMVTMEVISGELTVKFSDDFMTDFALGTFIYLANSNSSGTTIRNEGIELGEITTNGSHTFNVTANFPNATLNQFQYVIVLCKPASIPFGFAQLD
ncbi:MAG: Ig-like domain-containing protein [Cyclobacteriaceae bacterium]